MARRGYVVGGSHWISDSAYAKRLAKDWAISTQRPVEVRTVDERGDFGRVIYTARPTKKNAGRMTKAQRSAKAKRAATRRRKINAAVVAWKKMNPGKKVPDAIRITPIPGSGGGFTVKPMKVNAGPQSYRKVKKEARKLQRRGMLEPGPMFRKWRRVRGVSKSGRSRRAR